MSLVVGPLMLPELATAVWLALVPTVLWAGRVPVALMLAGSAARV